jgi:hypothetical protein
MSGTFSIVGYIFKNKFSVTEAVYFIFFVETCVEDTLFVAGQGKNISSKIPSRCLGKITNKTTFRS